MSSFGLLSPLTIPFRFRRKSSSASTSASMDYNTYGPGDAAPLSSPLLSSSPLLTPLHLTRRHEYAEWQGNDYLDDLNGAICDPRDNVDDANYPWSCRTRPEHPLPYMHQPSPFLKTKIAAYMLRSDTPLSYSPPPFSSPPQTAYFYPQGDSAIADDCEEYDLESMDIHIRETYFATSAERGRWLSSPIASRVRSQAIPPMRGHSSPVKTLADASPPRCKSSPVEEQILTSSSKDRDEDLRCSSSLPPSSPLISPMSNFSFLGDECDGDFVVDPQSNSDDGHFFSGTPELSNSSTTCTSPVEPARASTPHEAPVIVPALHPTDPPCHSPGSIFSRRMSPCSSQSSKPVDIRAHVPGTSSSEPDDILSPLSHFELDLEAEPLKIPLSDTVNRPYPGQHTVSLGVTVGAAGSQERLSGIRSLSMDSIHNALDFSLDTVGGSSSNKRAKKTRKSTTRNSGTRVKKCGVIRSGSPPSDTKKRRGARSHSPKHSRPPSKKSKSSHCKDDCESRVGTLKVERLSRSLSRPAVDSESACPHHRKTPKPTDHAQPPQPTPGASTTLAPMDAADVEFHVSLAGMLIEALAASRATSMDSAALYLVLTQTHPPLTAERSREELLIDIATVLEAGRARCGMFEKVDSSGERSRHKAPESRWFYVPERDEDPERASLISAIMPRQKRNETKKYKQYYYQPLEKMSRWDPEDAP